ncbi:hypothetical protein [Larsenimonas rhizosphaerae]|uniref:hypothetical protein n=1 Tax=Larsenimonas rhizosphaerae TaxID=2944682 RepID=UPI0020335156|nr:hypothetical protein [Larsenimonas rhizosphaerae]MCM2130442.1 hypothetical protein [Larsenimonas rhizosphaerae]
MTDQTAFDTIVTIEHIEALRAHEPLLGGQVVQVLYHTYFCHGGGRFVASDDTSSGDDNGLVIVSRKGCRWKRLLEHHERGNILNWGADPSGEKDSAPAFMAAVADEEARTVVVPHEGFYRIGQSVDLVGHVSLLGGACDEFGQRSAYSNVVAGIGLDGPMFINVGGSVQGIAFDGCNQKGGGLHLLGYGNVIKDCTFNSFKEAVVMPGGGEVSLVDNIFTRTGMAIRITGAVTCMTGRFIRNRFQCVHDCIVAEGELVGSNFVDNSFEHVSGKGIHGRVVHDCYFQGNWWECRNGAEDGSCISADNYQQFFNNTACANYCIHGWVSIFSDERCDNRIGGVMTGSGQVIARLPVEHAIQDGSSACGNDGVISSSEGEM